MDSSHIQSPLLIYPIPDWKNLQTADKEAEDDRWKEIQENQGLYWDPYVQATRETKVTNFRVETLEEHQNARGQALVSLGGNDG